MTYSVEEEVFPTLAPTEMTAVEEPKTTVEQVETKSGGKRKLPDKPTEKKVCSYFLSTFWQTYICF